MESFVYFVGAVYLAASVDRVVFWEVEVIEGRRGKVNKYKRKKTI